MNDLTLDPTPLPQTSPSDRLTSWLRTVVPGLWAALVAWAVARWGLPDYVSGWLYGAGAQLVVPAVLALTYAGLRWLEPRLPDWATRLLLGSARPPAYAPTPERIPWRESDPLI